MCFLSPSQAGKALKLLSGVSLIGGIAGVAAAALEAGDRYVQTRRIVKVSLYSCVLCPRVFRMTEMDAEPDAAPSSQELIRTEDLDSGLAASTTSRYLVHRFGSPPV